MATTKTLTLYSGTIKTGTVGIYTSWGKNITADFSKVPSDATVTKVTMSVSDTQYAGSGSYTKSGWCGIYKYGSSSSFFTTSLTGAQALSWYNTYGRKAMTVHLGLKNNSGNNVSVQWTVKITVTYTIEDEPEPTPTTTYTVKYRRKGGWSGTTTTDGWATCYVYYYIDGKWVQCMAYYYTGGAWHLTNQSE